MIFISDNDLTIRVQRLRRTDPVGGYTLYMHYGMGNMYYTLPVEDTGDEYVMVFVIPASFTRGLASGEYAYSIIADSRIVTSGMARKKEVHFPADTVYTGTVESGNRYTVLISAPVGGFLYVDGERYQTYRESVPEGREILVQAVPDEHHTFDQWSDGETENPRTVVVNNDITLAASFEAVEYTVSISAGSNGSVSVNGVQGDYSQTVPYGTVLTIEGTGSTGYGFTGWSDGNTDNPRQLVVDGDTTLTASFAIGMYQVTITAGQNGTISVNGTPGNYSQTVSYGTQLVLEATPSSGYDFTEWSDGNSDNPRTLTVTGPVSLTSAYAAESYAVSIVSEDTAEGNVVVNGATGDYSRNVAYGTQLTISVSPSQHYSFVMWSDGIITETRTVTVTGPLTLTAVFTIDTYNVSITSGSNGYVSVNGVIGDYSQVLPYGTVLAIEADPNTGYNFTQWSDGVSTASRTLTVTSDITLSASFAVQTFSVSISAGQDGAVSVNGTPGDYSATVDYGTVLTAEATADQDYEFTQWSDGDTSNPRTITVTSNVTLTAAFQEAVQPSALNTIRYTTTDGQVNTDWVYAFDKDNNALTPIDTRYGRLVYDRPVVEMYIRSANAGNISSITTGYMVKLIEVYDTLTSLSNCTRLILKSPQLQGVLFSAFPNLQYLEAWYANNNATLSQINTLENNNGVCVTRTDNNLWQNSDISGWTFQALGTSYTYEAQQQVDLTNHNVYNRNGGPLTPVSHTFTNGVGTVTYAETIGEFRDDWSYMDKVYWPDTVGYIDYSYGWNCDVELGEYAGVVGGGQYASGNWNYQNLFGSGIRPDCTVTVKETNPILTIGTDGCIYNKEDWMGLYVAGQTLDSNNYIAELDMDDRCVDASTCMLGSMMDTDGITRLVLGDSCQSLKLYERANYGEFSIRVGELVLNDALRSLNPNREYITHASGGSNNPYLNVINSGYTIESENGQTIYWCGDTSVDLSGYTVFAESCCAGLYFSSMPNISSATQVDRNAFTDVSGVSTWVWPSNTVTFNGSHCLKSNDVTRMEFGTHAPVYNNNESESLFQLGNISTLVFNSTTLPTQTDQYNPLFQELPQNGTIYIPVGSDYSTFLNYSGNVNNIGQWTVKYIMDNNQLAIKHTPGVTITAPTLTGLTMVASADSNGWLKVTYSGNITAYDSTDLQNNTDVLEIVLPDSCLSIGNGAFLNCSGLTKITISDNCTAIGNSAFYGTALTEFTAQGVTSFGSGAFGNCTSLTRLDFGPNLASFGNGALYNCSSLEEINFLALNGPTITNNDLGSGIHATGTIYIPRYANDATYADFINAMPSGWTVVRRKQNQILYQTNDGQPIDNVPSSMYGASLVSHTYQNGWGIIEYAGSSIYSIEGYAFTWKRNMTYLSLPELQDAVDWNAFSGCESLTTLEIGDCHRINGNSFEYCPIVNGPDANTLTLPPSLETMDGGAFPSFAGTTVMFGPALTRISGDAINLQNATDIWVYTTNTMEDQGNPFLNTPASGTLHMVPGADVPYWTQYLPGWTVVNDLSVITYTTNNNRKVEPLASAFDKPLVYNSYDGNGKGTLAFNGLLTTIDSNAFNGCTNLSTVAIPVTVTSVSNNAFNYTALTGFKIENGPDGNSVNDGVYYSKYDSIERNGLFMANTRTDSGGTHRADLLIVGTANVSQTNEVYTVDTRAFKGNSALTSYRFGPCIELIMTEAFMDCTNLSTIRLGSNTGTAFGGSRNIYTFQFRGVASTGTLYGQSGKDYSWFASKLPSGWTVSQ